MFFFKVLIAEQNDTTVCFFNLKTPCLCLTGELCSLPRYCEDDDKDAAWEAVSAAAAQAWEATAGVAAAAEDSLGADTVLGGLAPLVAEEEDAAAESQQRMLTEVKGGGAGG